MNKLILLFIVAISISACTQRDESYTDAMSREHVQDSPSPNTTAYSPSVPVLGGWVTFGQVDSVNVNGYFSVPEGFLEPMPAIIVIHEWWGLNENMQMMTDRLA